ncbi:hypothetical protein MRS44_015088 [Fusarium solani]|jgi:L-ascorbate metabolism protein UlaG (beta-lactamase superfamily)|uniref:uncharacterized protein n=1 Tax=Fusarium solani TaxID=169388 RepID=UPI0032C4211D|nr:hypothetical protein MRS44_015088 [Fusarium solani]
MAPPSFQTPVHVTRITTATAILEVGGVTFITDPVFGEAPAEYEITHLMSEGTQPMFAKFMDGPALKLQDLPIIDAVLLSHEDHIDNLDFEGRRLLDGRRVITTPDGAKNLAPRPGVATIKSWETLTLLSPSMEAIGILLKFHAHIFQAARSPASFFALRHLE